MSMMDKMMGFMMSRMSKEEKEAMMGRMMPKMMQGEKMMEMMPQMMMSMMAGEEGEGGMKEMMSKMKECGKDMEMPMMSQMMMEMMPKCLTMMLPNLPKEKRIDFVSKMVTTLVEQGTVGMSEEEKKDFHEQLAEKVEL
ncbi:MAG: hypothetical protein V3S33_02500 [Gammaproteobacteria bacterium]